MGRWGATLTFPKRRNLCLWQDLTKNIVQIYYLLKPTLQTSFMSAFCHFIKLSVHRLLLNSFANLVSKDLPPTTRELRLKWSVRNHLKDNREKNKTSVHPQLQFPLFTPQDCVYRGCAHLFLAWRHKWISWPKTRC